MTEVTDFLNNLYRKQAHKKTCRTRMNIRKISVLCKNFILKKIN